jgi:uncharacterized protein YjiS (DUF1127 family)
MRISSPGIGIEAAMRMSEVKRYFVECVRRVHSRYELIALSERDLADMGMTRLDAFNEAIKPFWEE